MKIINVTSTWQYKLKRVLKYLLMIVVIMFVCSLIDATVKHFINNPWFTFKEDWKCIYGAMLYRLISTWNYE